MRYFESLAEIPADAFPHGTAVAIGKFDGVHRGHQALIARARAAAELEELDPVVITFIANPQRRLNPQRRVPSIMSRNQRLEALKEQGVSACIMVPFDDEFAAMTAEAFVEEVLLRRVSAKHLSVGPDFRFGNGGLGNVEYLIRAGERLGFAVDVMPVVQDGSEERFSSTRIREAIMEGDVGLAARMLGRPHTVRATVVHGDARGRELGFPTANLGENIEGFVPAEGVYAGRVVVGDEFYDAALSVGNNPTFTPEAEPRVEAFILDFDQDIYGEPITVQFIERLRGNETFDGIEPLIVQMNADVERTREILASVG